MNEKAECSCSTLLCGEPGPGYMTAKAIMWIGERFLRLVDWAYLAIRNKRFQYALSKWKKNPEKNYQFPASWLNEINILHAYSDQYRGCRQLLEAVLAMMHDHLSNHPGYFQQTSLLRIGESMIDILQ